MSRVPTIDGWGILMTTFDKAWGILKGKENLETKPPSYQGIGCAMCGEEAKMFIQCKLHPLMPYEWDDANFCSNCASEMMSMGGCSPCQNGEPPWSDD